MKFELFMNFNGDCREAVSFYADIFGSEIKNMMTVGEAPADPNLLVKETDKDLIMYAEVKIGDKNIMFMDMTSDCAVTVGNNINPTLNLTDKGEISRIFDRLKEGGKAIVEPGRIFFSEWYCMVEDRFGIVWHLLLAE